MTKPNSETTIRRFVTELIIAALIMGAPVWFPWLYFYVTQQAVRF